MYTFGAACALAPVSFSVLVLVFVSISLFQLFEFLSVYLPDEVGVEQQRVVARAVEQVVGRQLAVDDRHGELAVRVVAEAYALSCRARHAVGDLPPPREARCEPPRGEVGREVEARPAPRVVHELVEMHAGQLGERPCRLDARLVERVVHAMPVHHGLDGVGEQLYVPCDGGLHLREVVEEQPVPVAEVLRVPPLVGVVAPERLFRAVLDAEPVPLPLPQLADGVEDGVSRHRVGRPGVDVDHGVEPVVLRHDPFPVNARRNSDPHVRRC